MVYKVLIRHNLVQQIVHLNSLEPGCKILESNLEAGTAIAQNNVANGCIDGEYCFTDYEQAKSFAILSLDFVDKTVEAMSADIERLNSGEEYGV